MKDGPQVKHHLVVYSVHSVNYRGEWLGVFHCLDYISELVPVHAAVVKE